MEPTICARCKKNVAVIFITKIDGSNTKNEGLCLKCARELHIKPVDDIISKMGLSDEDLDALQGDMGTMLGEGLAALQQSATDADENDAGGVVFVRLSRHTRPPFVDSRSNSSRAVTPCR